MHGHSQTDIISIKHLSEVAERLLRLIEANWQIIRLPYFKLTEIKQAKVWQQLTWGLLQVWLDGRTIGGFAKPNFSSGRTSNSDHQILTSTK
jgi:hypothetical protein